MTLNFWYLLQDTLLDDYYMPSDVAVDDTADEIEMLGSGSLDSANMVPAAEAKAAHEAVRKASIQVFLHLSRILCEKSAFPADDEWTRWPLDVQKKFRSYRRECGDTLVYCHYIVRDDLLAQLAQSLAKVTADLQLATVQWQPVEALQFAVRSIAEVVANDESMFMPAIFETMFTRLPRTVPRIAQTCIAVVGMHVGLRRVFLGGILFPETGAYAAWMNVHDSRYLFQSLELLTPFLTQPPSAAEGNTLAGEIARSAFRALRDVADVCRSHLVTSVDSFINLFLNVDGITAANRVELAESVGRIIQAMELSRQSAPLQMIIENIAGKMNHALTVMHQQVVGCPG